MTSARELVEVALAEVTTIAPGQAKSLLGAPGVLFVDIREAAELESEGRIPGAFHAPRGLLEFLADPGSAWHQPELAPGRRLLLFCAVGWRSALAAKALQDMGRSDVCHLGGGFMAWQKEGGAIDAPP